MIVDLLADAMAARLETLRSAQAAGPASTSAASAPAKAPLLAKSQRLPRQRQVPEKHGPPIHSKWIRALPHWSLEANRTRKIQTPPPIRMNPSLEISPPSRKAS